MKNKKSLIYVCLLLCFSLVFPTIHAQNNKYSKFTQLDLSISEARGKAIEYGAEEFLQNTLTFIDTYYDELKKNLLFTSDPELLLDQYEGILYFYSNLAADCKTFGSTISKNILTVGMEVGYPPFEYFDNDGYTYIGFDVELSELLAEKLGLKLYIVDTSWDGIFDGLNANKYDCIISAVTRISAREEFFNFTKDYVGLRQVLVNLKSDKTELIDLHDLKGKKIAYQFDEYSDNFSNFFYQIDREGINIVKKEFDKQLECFTYLQREQCDYILCDELIATGYTFQENSPFQITWTSDPDPYEGLSIALKKGNNILTDKISKALTELYEEGLVTELSMKYFGRDIISPELGKEKVK